MKFSRQKIEPKVSAGSMADIAFLLLIFFLVSTNLLHEEGLMIQLPPNEPPTDVPIKERNLFKVLINSNDEYLIEGQVTADLSQLTEEIKRFVLNPSSDPALSQHPKKAIISIKTQRGTQYASFILILDLIKESYYQMYGERVGLTSHEFRSLNSNKMKDRVIISKAKRDLPMNISIAEPDQLTTL